MTARPAPRLWPVIRIGGVVATVQFAGMVSPGEFQFNVVVPNIAASDAVPVTFSLGGVNGAQTLYTSVGN